MISRPAYQMGDKMIYVGLDVHKSFSQAIVMTETGEIIKEGKIKTEKRALIEFFKEFSSIEIAMEATGLYEPIYEWLEKQGYKIRLSHPLKTKAIAYAKVKTDKVDARILADLLRANLLPHSYVPPKEIRNLRNLCRERKGIVEERTKWKNRIRAELAKNGIREFDFTKKGKEWLKSLGIEKINRMLSFIEIQDEKIKEIDKEIREIAKGNEEIKILETVPGIGTYAATFIYAEIGDIGRFSSSEHLCSYAGLVPSTYQSGNIMKYGRITKEGSRYLRWIIIECTQIHVNRYDSNLTRFYKRLSMKKGKQKALVATARKMLKAIYWMLKKKEQFKYFLERLGG